jgi:hypothetical protein
VRHSLAPAIHRFFRRTGRQYLIILRRRAGAGVGPVLDRANEKFEFPVHWGVDLQSEHERYLT